MKELSAASECFLSVLELDELEVSLPLLFSFIDLNGPVQT